MAALAATSAPRIAQSADKPKICFVYPGSRSDGGWSQSHESGRLQVEKELGSRVTTDFAQNVPEGPQSEAVFERLVTSGCNMIFADAFGYMDAVLKISAKYPNVKFEHASGYQTTRNVATFNARFYQARYLFGRIAAKASKSGKAIYVAPFPIPDVLQGINAFALGARSINPDFETIVVWTGSWFAPEKEAKAVEEALKDSGADIVTQQTDSTAPMQVAEAKDVHGFAQYSDLIALAPRAQLTGLIENWGAYDIRRIKAFLDGSWSSKASFDGMKTGTVALAPFTNMPEAILSFAKDSEAKLISGKLQPFRGPIKKQNGSVWLKKGEVAGDETLFGMDFLVAGVKGDIPKN